jgi:predicted ATPase
LAIQGQGEVGIDQMQQGLASSSDAGTGLGRAPVMTQLAEVYGIAGRTEVGLHALEQARVAMEITGEHWWAAETYRLQGVLLLQQSSDNAAEPESCFHQALEVARRQQAKSWELRAATSLARLWQSQDKRQDAYDLLAPVYEWFTEGFDTADLQEAKVLLEALKA